MKKDRITLYFARNIFAVFVIAVAAMALSIHEYYQSDLAESLQRVFIYNIMTTLYLLFLSSLNYVIFEFFKVLMDEYKEKLSISVFLVAAALSIVIRFLPIHPLFQYNFCLLFLLISLRVLKQLYKKKIT